VNPQASMSAYSPYVNFTYAADMLTRTRCHTCLNKQLCSLMPCDHVSRQVVKFLLVSIFVYSSDDVSSGIRSFRARLNCSSVPRV